MPTARTLILWDVDHTLLETRGSGGRFARAAFHEITGVEPVRMAVATGKTEAVILEETLQSHGLASTEDYQRRYAQALPRQYRRNVDQLRRSGRALPGAAPAIAAISRMAETVQSVLTGNYRAVAAVKLATFDLTEGLALDVGAYADDAADRSALVAIAQRRAGDKHRCEFTRANTVVIGDTTHDVTAALRGGARIVAIATGKDPAEALRAAGADSVLADLTDTERVLRAIGSVLAEEGRPSWFAAG